MAVWRRRALAHFPELRQDLTARGYNPYSLFFDLQMLLPAAYDGGDEDLLRRIFGFAEWCARQTAKELWNPAGVSFYEHLFDDPAYSDRVLPWLSPAVVYAHWNLWEAIAPDCEWARVKNRLEPKRAEGERQYRMSRDGRC
jgi:hypothetical protein